MRDSRLRCYQTANTFDCCIWRKWFFFFFFMVTPLQPLLILSRTDCVLTSGPFKSTSQLSDIQKQDFEEKPRNNTPAPNLPSHRSAHVSDGSGCKLAHRGCQPDAPLAALTSQLSSSVLTVILYFIIHRNEFVFHGFFPFFPKFVLTKLSQWFRRREVEVDDTQRF